MSTSYPRVKSTLLFNSTNGLFITAIGKPLEGFVYDETKYIAREVEYSLRKDTVVGGIIINGDEQIDDFTIVTKDELATTVYERALNVAVEREITSQYPLIEQINVLTNAIVSIVGSNEQLKELDSIQTLLKMSDFISAKLLNNVSKKEDCINCKVVTFVSDQELLELNKQKLEGVVDRPAATAKPRVFKTD